MTTSSSATSASAATTRSRSQSSWPRPTASRPSAFTSASTGTRGGGRAPSRLADLLDEHDWCWRRSRSSRVSAVTAPAAMRRRARGRRVADGRQFGCRYLQAIGPAGGPCRAAGQAFGSLCDRAADHGLVVGLEFLPFTERLRRPRRARHRRGRRSAQRRHLRRHLASRAGRQGSRRDRRTAGGAGDGRADERRHPEPEDPDYYTDCLTNRRPTGDGEFDVAGFIAALRRAGVTAWSMEVCSKRVGRNPPPTSSASPAGCVPASHRADLDR